MPKKITLLCANTGDVEIYRSMINYIFSIYNKTEYREYEDVTIYSDGIKECGNGSLVIDVDQETDVGIAIINAILLKKVFEDDFKSAACIDADNYIKNLDDIVSNIVDDEHKIFVLNPYVIKCWMDESKILSQDSYDLVFVSDETIPYWVKNNESMVVPTRLEEDIFSKDEFIEIFEENKYIVNKLKDLRERELIKEESENYFEEGSNSYDSLYLSQEVSNNDLNNHLESLHFEPLKRQNAVVWSNKPRDYSDSEGSPEDTEIWENEDLRVIYRPRSEVDSNDSEKKKYYSSQEASSTELDSQIRYIEDGTSSDDDSIVFDDSDGESTTQEIVDGSGVFLSSAQEALLSRDLSDHYDSVSAEFAEALRGPVGEHYSSNNENLLEFSDELSSSDDLVSDEFAEALRGPVGEHYSSNNENL